MLPFRPPRKITISFRQTTVQVRRYSVGTQVAIATLLVLGLPPLFTLLASIMGLSVWRIPAINSWIMGSLTAAATMLFAAAVDKYIRTRTVDWFWLSITGSACLFWGSVFYQSIRMT